jgi:hypothetical protein
MVKIVRSSEYTNCLTVIDGVLNCTYDVYYFSSYGKSFINGLIEQGAILSEAVKSFLKNGCDMTIGIDGQVMPEMQI